MSSDRDVQEVIEVLTIAIARQEAEEQFFRRSAVASTDEVTRTMFLEIADDLARYVQSLEERRQRLMESVDE